MRASREALTLSGLAKSSPIPQGGMMSVGYAMLKRESTSREDPRIEMHVQMSTAAISKHEEPLGAAASTRDHGTGNGD